MESAVNVTVVRGKLASPICPSHLNHGKQFYKFSLTVARLSGVVDTLPIIAEESLLPCQAPCVGDTMLITGQIRSHNTRNETGRHLMVFLFANEIVCEDGPAINDVTIEGILCREPNLRRTPMGRDICDLMVAVPRAFQRADYLPCILWGRTAIEAADYHTRDCIRILGRMQSRVYTKQTASGSAEYTAYEISALSAQFLTDSVL